MVHDQIEIAYRPTQKPQVHCTLLIRALKDIYIFINIRRDLSNLLKLNQ